MRGRLLVGAVIICTLFAAIGCSGQSGGGAPGGGAPEPNGAAPESAERGSGGGISAKAAVDLAYASLEADWKPQAKLAFVGRYSPYMNREFPPLDVEQDPGIGSDGFQEHWVVIFGDVAAGQAKVFYVENGNVELVHEDLATIRPDQYFEREGWVDSTEIKFRGSQRVGLELKTNETFRDVDQDLAQHPLLWLAETSFGRFDVYDAITGEYIKSR